MQNDKEKFKKEFISRLVKFSLLVLKLGEKMRKERILWPIIDQLVRSSTSIGANVVEAKSSSSRRDYLKFFEIALKSANETKYWLILVKESSNDFKVESDNLLKEIKEISNVIGASVLTLKGKN
ncbi:MAG: four helix bundle protein [Candidatus Omnitrophota bacterium]